ncbi:MAG: PAS domain-containing protein [Chromatiales bacterium]|nr:PAS domain-containing protein [Chromatiales bacterium]
MAVSIDDPMIVRAMGKGQFVRVSDAFKARTGFDVAELAGKPFLDWIAPGDRARVQAALDNGETSFSAGHITRDGRTLPLHMEVAKQGDGFYVLGRSVPTTAQPEADQPSAAEATMAGTLDAIARIVEEQNPEFKCSILLVDQGRFVFGAGPSLPDEYNAAVNGYAVGPNVGSCGTAIFWNTPVIVSDIQADPLWAPLAGIAKRAGVAACWSHPFVSSSGKVLGALAFYATEPRTPTPRQLSHLRAAARITGLAVERGRAEEALIRAEAATHAARNQLQAILNAMPDLLFEVDVEGRVLEYHTHRLDLLGWQPDAFLGKRFAEVLPPDAADAFQRAIDGAAQHGVSYGETYRSDSPQGELWFELSAAPLQADDEAGPRFVLISRDITQRHADAQALEDMKAALARSRDLLQQVIDTVPLRVFWKDREGRYLGCNPAFAHDAGKASPDDLLGLDDYAMGWAAQADLYRADDKRVVESGQPRLNYEEPQATPDGKTIWLRTSKTPLYDRQGENIGVLGVYDDITEYKREERRIALAMEAAQILIWEIDFVAGKLGYEGSALVTLGLDASDAPDTLEGWVARVHPDDRGHFMALVAQALLPETVSGFDCEYRFENRHDGYAWLQTVGRVTHRDAASQPLLGAGYTVNIDARKRTELALKASEEAQRSLIAALPDVIMRFDAEGRHLFVSDNAKEVTGLPAAAFVGKTHHEIGFPEAMCEFWEQAIRQPFLTGEPYETEFELDGPTGHGVFNWRLTPDFGADGKVKTVLAVARDITQRKQAEAALKAREQYQRAVLDNFPFMVWLKDTESRLLAANQAYADIAGLPSSNDLEGKTDLDLFPEEDARHYRADDLEVLRSGKAKTVEEPLFSQGRTIWIETYKSPVTLDGKTIGTVGFARDISDRKQYQQQLEHIAHYDTLTGLPNRVLLADRLQQAMRQVQRRDTKVAVAYLDLDGFKAVNDQYGHDVGDQLLTSLAGHMKRALREGDTLARLGGDEFVAILLDLPDVETTVPMLSRLLAAANEVFHKDDHALRVSASLGVTFYPQAEPIDADQLLRQADQAMYQAKLAGKNRYRIFDADHDRSVRGHHESLERIRQALHDREFVLHYQPKVNMRTGEVIGAEALIRWRHPERGVLPPGKFLPLITNHPLAIQIGEWVLDTAMQQIEDWKAVGLSLPVSVNIDAIQLEQADFVDRLRRLVANHPGLAPGDLELEVLESSALKDFGQVSRVIRACHEIGVGFALDDFGTGYSSLTYLKRLPAGMLKIDQSFVRDMLDDPDDLAILSGILGLATSFRRRVIAEGVETLEHGEMLLHMGCELGQGYAIARPMPPEDMLAWLAAWHPDASWLDQMPISHDDLPILFASVEHRAWLTTVESFVRGGSSSPPALNPDQCMLRKWLKAEAGRDDGNRPEIEALGTLHSEIHRLAGELIRMKEEGQAEAAVARLPELYPLRDRLLAMLLDMQR